MFAVERIKAYKAAHKALADQPHKMVLTVDFTQHQTSMANKFHDLIFVVATKDPLSIPDSILNHQVPAHTPPNRDPTFHPIEQVKLPRRTRREIHESEIPGRPESQPNIRSDVASCSKAMKLPPIDVVDVGFKPECCYFHFIVNRCKETPATQTFDYVEWAFNFLFENQLFEGFSELEVWSDGCGKHLKCYNTHYGMAKKQAEWPSLKISWNMLAPNKAHNRADAAAAHLKVATTKLIDNFYLLSSINHLAFSNCKVANSIIVEAEFE